ncbi:pyridine nucleotide-disulfide oxidoreductase domain-containing protein 1-like [Lineus longissimus]|uniref:pyridine nucleotide-disulfide oxidoreductase domain-containing protein 1-like n=1 Tax=Lineus longissimus TaxID=88925 RepID=UPI002B4C840E
MDFKYVVVGGGIAGVTCVETLSLFCQEESILLISASPLVKAVMNFRQVSKTLEEFDVQEQPLTYLEAHCPNVKVVHAAVVNLDPEQNKVTTNDGVSYTYKKLCLCCGAKPKVIAKDNPYVLGIRDTESIEEFQKKLVDARRVVVVGNGGIATEIVYEIEGYEVIWAIKDPSISSTFVDPGAAEFFVPHLSMEKDPEKKPVKRVKYTTVEKEVAVTSPAGLSGDTLGGALGPDWSNGLLMTGKKRGMKNIHVEYNVEVKKIMLKEEFLKAGLTATGIDQRTDDASWPVYLELTNEKIYGCDIVVSATGVVPNTGICHKGGLFELADDGGMKVNDNMCTNIKDVYAAGDMCTANWEPAPHWLQMRLWTQARQMGHYVAKCMVANLNEEEISPDICFELFSHVTKFFGYKVVLLGKFNAQGYGKEYEILLRMTKGVEFIKVIMKDGRMCGAILIGDTDLEETFENLILNQMDLSAFGEELLDPNIDIGDYFD